MNHLINGSSPTPLTIASTTNPDTTVANLEYTQWFKQDQLLLTWLVSSLTDEV